jgi:replicative DNA helicase
MLADLRESGQLEQDADVVMMVYRDDYYRPETHLKGFGEILIRKNRDGAVGDVLLKWVPEHTRWIDHHGPWPEKPVEAGEQGKVVKWKPRGSE